MQTEFPNASQTQLKRWAMLADAKARHEEGLFLAEGVKVVEELLASDWQIKHCSSCPKK
jgi:tRNA G18 (ribose-2'-O)-methylase SpoU